jgi:hypothetical protein
VSTYSFGKDDNGNVILLVDGKAKGIVKEMKGYQYIQKSILNQIRFYISSIVLDQIKELVKQSEEKVFKKKDNTKPIESIHRHLH